MKIAAIGDVHLAFDEADIALFNSSDYAAILITGDLPGMRHERAYEIAERISKLTPPTFMIPGNHDATTLPQLLSDIAGVKGGPLNRPEAHIRRVERLRAALSPVTLGGYTSHALAEDLSLLIARPHAQGGGLSFPAYLKASYGVSSMEESTERLIALIDACPSERLIVLAHNGPSGLGDSQQDIWGCDFKRQGGDWGDPDLEAAISYAKEQGKEVLALIAGHMHQRTRQGLMRTWHLEKTRTHYINAAHVPRIMTRDGRRMHHHIALSIKGLECQVETRWIAAKKKD